MTTFKIILLNIRNIFKVQYLAIKILTHTPFINKWQRGLPKSFFINKPPLPTPYWYRALLLSAINLIIRQQHLHTALPTHRFFSSTFFCLTRQLGLNSFHWQDTIIVKNLYSWVVLSVPVVLLAVHSTCPSRCPLTILVLYKRLI